MTGLTRRSRRVSALVACFFGALSPAPAAIADALNPTRYLSASGAYELFVDPRFVTHRDSAFPAVADRVRSLEFLL